ncbi:MAG: ATP-dependent DNA helicase [Patescibacteria group bacterium]|nr:ATP-dependent DNA helicase [Patescibacteria group bacterium]
MKINQAQKLAINTIEGPVLVIAGPGTGKTEIIARRIAKILKSTDTPPEAILALTFTESGAKAMRDRLLSAIGETAYYVNISTFHAFCSGVMQEFPDKFIISSELEPLSELEQVEIFHQILSNHNFKFIKPINQPFYYTASIINSIQSLKRESITPKIFSSILKQEKDSKDLNKNKELLKAFIDYQKIIKERGRYDFEDMINLVVNAFKKDKDLLLTYQEKLLYFLVDEYQDTNSSQNQVVDLLASYWGDQANIFVVGDANQSIFRFQGSSLENIIGFTKTYPKVKIITLDQNYRSTQTILDASFNLIQKNHFKVEELIKSIKTKLLSKYSKPDLKINTINLPQDVVENYWIANQVKKLIKKNVKPEEIAVLYRHNQDSIELSNMFAKLNIPFNIEGGGNILKDPTINKLLILLKVINNYQNNLEDPDLFTLLHFQFLKFNPLDILKLTRAASKKRSNLIDTILSKDFKKLDLTDPDRFTSFINQLADWQQLNNNLSFTEFFEILLKESNFLNWVLISKDAVEKLNKLNSLFSEIKKINTANHQLNLESFLKALDLMEINNLKIIEKDLDIQNNSITLSTAHKAKGKEWQYVFIYKAINGKWGNNRIRELIKLPSGILKNTILDKKEKNEDERRLFYVCLTRAKKKLYISYADKYTTASYTKEAFPTMFISELPKNAIKPINPKSLKSKKILKLLLSPAQTKNISSKEQEFLKNLIKNFKLSPTALNTYLTCPYKFKLNNLLKVPRAKISYLSFGSAVHKALEMFYRKFIENNKCPNKKYLLTQYKHALDKEVLIPQDHQARLKQGKETLSNYFDYYQDSFSKPLYTEKFFGSGWSKTYLKDIPLSGKIDRIDWVNQKEKTVKVIDYKTGKPKSRNDILGKTKYSEGDYYRQLVFYKLLSQLSKNFQPKVVELELDFVETNSSGKFKKENFKISDADINNLKKTIKKSMKKIRSLNFSKTKKTSHCDRCEYQSHCYPNGLPKNIQGS